jgi:hypothetical protein
MAVSAGLASLLLTRRAGRVWTARSGRTGPAAVEEAPVQLAVADEQPRSGG